MSIPREFIDELIERVDIVDYISSYVPLTKKGTYYFGLCPFHGEKTPSFAVNREKKFFKCFGCGQGGNIISFIMEYDHKTFIEAIEVLASKAGLPMPANDYYSPEKEEENKKYKETLELIKNTNLCAKNYFIKALNSSVGKDGLAYLEQRKLSPEIIARFGLGYCPGDVHEFLDYMKSQGFNEDALMQAQLIKKNERGAYPFFYNRVIYPYYDINGNVIGFGGRILEGDGPKYLNSPDTPYFKKGKNLYGLNFAKKTKNGFFILCEGYMDVISLHQKGFINAVAACGTAFKDSQAALMKRFHNKILLSLDSDGAGVKGAMSAVEILRNNGFQIKVLNLKPAKDPDEFIKQYGVADFKKRIGESKNAFLWEIEKIKENYDLNDPSGMAAFKNEIAERLKKFDDQLEIVEYMRAVCTEHNIPESDLRLALKLELEEKNNKNLNSVSHIEDNIDKKKEVLSPNSSLERKYIKICSASLAYISEDLSPEDFVDEFCAETYKNLLQGKTVQKLIDELEDDSKLKEFLSKLMFEYSEYDGDSEESSVELSEKYKSSAIDFIKKIKSNSYDRLMKNTNDLSELKNLQAKKNNFLQGKVTFKV